MEPDKVFTFLDSRRGLLDGIVLSGGEATLYSGLVNFTEHVKAMGFAVKLDTNGTRPETVRTLLKRNLLDYVSLDYKAPPAKFEPLTHCTDWQDLNDTLSCLIEQSAVPFEIRTTVHTDLLNENDINTIITDLAARNYRGTYYVQNFVHNHDRPTLGNVNEQQRFLDMGKIVQHEKLTVAFRNF